MKALLLASTSPYRAKLLTRLRVPFKAAAHRVDEDAYKARGLPPDELAEALALAKAESVREGETFVLGGDQVVELDGDVLGKPGDAEGARSQLRRLSGRTHRLLTATALVGPRGWCETNLHINSMTLRTLSEAEIERYVEADQPFDCCGSYRIENLGPSLFSRVEGRDPTAIEGLPLIKTSEMLRAAGWRVP